MIMAQPAAARRVLGAVISLLLLTSGTAWADTIATFGFTDLVGEFDPATDLFAATPDGFTDGEVSRTVDPTGTAAYYADFTGGTAVVSFQLTVSNVTGNSADSMGWFTISDVDGDAITAEIEGAWSRAGGYAFFMGNISNTFLLELGDGLFEGPSGGSFSMNLDTFGREPYEGTVQLLGLVGTWFDAPFADANLGAQGAIVPEPATVLAVAFMALLGIRRR